MSTVAPPRTRARRSWSRVTRFAAALTLGVSVSLAAGCSGDDDDGPSGNIDGTYSLTQVDGESLPYNVTVQGGSVSLRGGRLALDDGQYEVVFDLRVNGQSSTLLDDAGTYERSGSRIRFSSDEEGADGEGTLSGSRIDINSDGTSFRFERD